MASQLDYAPRPPLTRRRTFRRVVVALLLMAVGVVGWRYGPWAWDRATLLYWQRQAMNYTAPADQVVFDNGPGHTTSFTADTPVISKPRSTYLAPPAECLGYGGRANMTIFPPVLFCHERKTPSGKTLLVLIQLVDTDTPNLRWGWTSLAAYFVTPATWTNEGSTRLVIGRGSYSNNDQPMRIFAGQPDPNDPTHFTVAFEEAGKPNVFHGRLNDEGSIDFSITP